MTLNKPTKKQKLFESTKTLLANANSGKQNISTGKSTKKQRLFEFIEHFFDFILGLVLGSDLNKAKEKTLKRLWGNLPVIFLIFLVIVIIGLFGMISSKKEAIKAEQTAKMQELKQEINVVTLKLTPSTISEKITLPGIIKPWVDLTVVSEVSGKVIKKVVKEGTIISKGDTIAEIDSRDYKNAFKASKASLQAARSSLRRLKQLSRDNLATRSELDNTIARVENLEASVDTALFNLKRCTITAPISGIVNNMMIEQGQYLKMATPVAQIIDTNMVKVKVGIPESDVEAVRTIDRFNVIISALNNKIFEAEKWFLSKTADPDARVYNLYLKLENNNQEILPDMFSRVEIVKQTVEKCISIPLYSVISGNNEQVVYVVKNDQAQLRKVELGLLSGWRVQVKSGLDPGEQLIVVGQRSVNHEDKVKIIRSISDPKDIFK